MEVSICKPYSAFGIDLSSKQRIHVLRESLYNAYCILCNIQDTIAKIRRHANKIAYLCHVSATVQEVFQESLENMASEVRNHKRTAWKLLRLSDDIKSMVSSSHNVHLICISNREATLGICRLPRALIDQTQVR